MIKDASIDLHPIKSLNGVSLTRREVDILSCLLSGKSNKSVALFLVMSHRTVETHLRSLMIKFERNSREDLIHLAEQSPHFLAFKKHYVGFLIESHFKRCLQDIARLIQRPPPVA